MASRCWTHRKPIKGFFIFNIYFLLFTLYLLLITNLYNIILNNMEIFNGSIRGRDKKYNFDNLEKENYIIFDSENDIIKERKLISSAIYQWKKYNKLNWITPVRIVNGKIYVYRIK